MSHDAPKRSFVIAFASGTIPFDPANSRIFVQFTPALTVGAAVANITSNKSGIRGTSVRRLKNATKSGVVAMLATLGFIPSTKVRTRERRSLSVTSTAGAVALALALSLPSPAAAQSSPPDVTAQIEAAFAIAASNAGADTTDPAVINAVSLSAYVWGLAPEFVYRFINYNELVLAPVNTLVYGAVPAAWNNAGNTNAGNPSVIYLNAELDLTNQDLV